VNRSIVVPEYQLEEEVRLDPARTALVVIDMQNDFVRRGGSLLVADAEATIPAVNRLLDCAREHELHVVSARTPTDPATPSGGSGPSTPARAAGAGASSTNSHRPQTISSCANLATTPSTGRHSTTSCGSGPSTRS